MLTCTLQALYSQAFGLQVQILYVLLKSLHRHYSIVCGSKFSSLLMISSAIVKANMSTTIIYFYFIYLQLIYNLLIPPYFQVSVSLKRLFVLYSLILLHAFAICTLLEYPFLLPLFVSWTLSECQFSYSILGAFSLRQLYLLYRQFFVQITHYLLHYLKRSHMQTHYQQ